MKAQHLFNSKGDWIAFRQGRHLFAPRGDWLGWFPWDDNDAVDPNGDYLGTVYLGWRLYRFSNREDRGYPGHAEYPGFPNHPGGPLEYPRPEENGWLPALADDVEFDLPPLREYMRQLANSG